MFITIEGTEGVGKSTLISGLESYLVQTGYAVSLTREPGGTPFAEKLRGILIDPLCEEEIAPETELLLLNACRIQNINNRIIPALKQGKTVICDRFSDAL
jgi:dTMP kinase